LHHTIGDLNKVKSAVKVLGFVAGDSDFYDQPKVINGGSQLLIDVFGEEAGKAARSAIGTNALPGNIPVEIEALFELK
jgi:enamine deaminase RidA (YjgF/YER057c/UK114 family)